MSRKHGKTIAAIFDEPIRANIRWDDVVSALASEGVSIQPLGGQPLGGSMYALAFGGTRHVVHKPHPGRELKKLGVRAFRGFCIADGIGPS